MKQLISKYKNLNRLHKSAVWIITFFVCYTLTGFLIVPPIIEYFAADTLTEILGRNTAIKKVRLNPFTLSLALEGFSISEKDDTRPFVAFDRFYVNLQSVSVLRLVPVVKEVKLENPFVRLERLAGNKYNFSDIIAKNRTDPPPKRPDPGSKPFRFALYNIELTGGRAEIVDEIVSKKHAISGLDITIPFISNLAEEIDVFVEPAFKVNINGTPIALSAKTKPFHGSLETSLQIDLQEIDLPYYFAYLPMKTNLNLASGRLDLSAGIHFHQAEDKTPFVSGEGKVAVSDLAVTDTWGDSFFNLSKFQMEMGRSHFLKPDIHLKKVEITTPEVAIVRRKDGSLNLFSLLPAAAKKETAEPQPPKNTPPSAALTCKLDEFSLQKARIYLKDAFKTAADAPPEPDDILTMDKFTLKDTVLASGEKKLTLGRADITGGRVNIRRQPADDFNFQALSPAPQLSDPEQKPPKEPDRKPPQHEGDDDAWNVTLSQLSVANVDINAQDLAAKNKGDFTVSDIRINAENISTQKGKKGNVTLKCHVNRDAEIDLKSRVQLTPVELKTGIDVKKIQLAWGQPFIEKKVGLVLKEGAVNLNGDLFLTMGTDAVPAALFKGNAAVEDLLIFDASEKEKLLQFKQLSIEKVDAGYPETDVNIAAVKLDGLISRVIRKADGSLNLSDVVPTEAQSEAKEMETKSAKEKPAQTPGDGFQLNVETVNVTNSEINFMDQSVTPDYDTGLKEITLTLKGINSQKELRADLNFAAKLDGHAPFKITGKLNPLPEKIFADLDFSFKDMELSSMSPYSGKYIGKKIKKGKLSLDLNYLINGSKLDASNKVFIDQMELGTPVASPDATTLPVGLGIALLKDRSGRINLDIPVSGDLNDPEFSLKSTILSVVTNLLAKAATSPFSLLASMFGGGEDINLVAFEPGADSLPTAEQDKLDTIVTALFERPSLEIEIKGYADITTDKTALTDAQFATTIAAEMEEKTDKSPATADADLRKLPLEEYEKYVRKVYKRLKKEKKKAGKFEEPDEVTLAFMENLIRNDIIIDDGNLKRLASKRALAVKDYLLASEKIAAKRIFIVETDSLLGKNADEKVKSRVELGIK